MYNNPSDSNNNIFGLNLLRVGAVVVLVLSNFILYQPQQHSLSAQIAPFLGFITMETLVVLSGFLWGRKLLKLLQEDSDFSSSTLWKLLRTSAWRVLPLYYLAIFLVFLIHWLVGYSTADFWKYFLFMQNFARPMPVFFSESWAMSVGIISCVLLIVALSVLTRMFRSLNKSSVLFIFSLVMIAFSIGSKFVFYCESPNTTIEQWNSHLKSVVIYRMDSFYLGVLFSWLSLQFGPYWLQYRLLSLVAGALILGFLFVGVGYLGWFIEEQPFFWEVVYLPLSSLAITLLLPFFYSWYSSGSAVDKIFAWGRNLSFALFLIHYSILIPILDSFFSAEALAGDQFVFVLLMYLLTALLISSLLYRFFEYPLTKLGLKN